LIHPDPKILIHRLKTGVFAIALLTVSYKDITHENPDLKGDSF
jgi:hypothetical protein